MPEESSAVSAAPSGQPEVHISAPSSNAPMPSGTDFTESFADLEKAMGEEAPKEVPKADPKAKSTASNADKKSSDTKASKTTDRDTSPAKDVLENGKTSSEEEQNGKPLPAPELRKAYQDLKAKHAQLQTEYETFKKAPREDPQTKTLSEKLAAAEKHRQSLDAELKHAAYERSQEFRERYHAPFVSAYELATEVAGQLQVTDAEGNVRQGTPADFDALMQIQDASAALKWAQEVYGPAGAAMMMNQRMEVIKHAKARNAALAEAQKMGAERDKARSEADLTKRRELATKWETLNKEAVEKYPQWFKPIEGDDKGNELLAKGYELADSAFNGNNMSPEQAVELHSAIRNRAAAFGREAHLRRKAERRITELETELKAYQASEPSKGEGKPGKAEPSELNWEAQLDSQWAT